MAIFGKAVMLNGSKTTLLRHGNDGDVFLNYFFAIVFILCLAIGIMLNPFIIAYHAQQKRTFAKFLFLIVSSIDQLKLLYLPLMLIPKLLSPLEDKDYYIIYNPKSVPLTAYPNYYLIFFVWFEADVLVILSVSRHISLAHSFSFELEQNAAYSLLLLLSFLKWVGIPTYVNLFQKVLLYCRLYDSITYTKYVGAFSYIIVGSTILFLIVGVIFVALTIIYLRNADTASSDISDRNIKRSIIFLIATSLFNVIVLVLCVIFTVAWNLELFTEYGEERTYEYTTWLDFFHFGVLYGTPMSQSVFNSISFLCISKTFREFLSRSFRGCQIADTS